MLWSMGVFLGFAGRNILLLYAAQRRRDLEQWVCADFETQLLLGRQYAVE